MDLALFYDIETNGMPDWKVPSDSEHQPHIVQIGALLVDRDTKEIVQSLNLIVRPDGWEITKELSDIHGITHEHALEVGLDENRVLNIFLELWAGRPRVAHNRTFDQRIIRIAVKRFKDEEMIEAWAEKETHGCTMLMSKPIMKLPGTKGYKFPSLAEAYKHFTGKEIEGAHSAMADVQACMEIYWKMVKK